MVCLLASAGCGHEHKSRGAARRDYRGSVIYVADPRVVSRLVRGFLGTDNPYWRWAAQESSIVVNTPKDARTRGAILVLHFAVVEQVLEAVKSVSLTITVDGLSLPTQHYDKPGQFTLRQDVPATALRFDPVRVDFTLDKALASSTGGAPDHGIIISDIALEERP